MRLGAEKWVDNMMGVVGRSENREEEERKMMGGWDIGMSL